jgi:hypothetical protein
MTIDRCLTSLAGVMVVSIGVTPARDSRVEKLLAQMTVEEKIDLLGGIDGF